MEQTTKTYLRLRVEVDTGELQLMRTAAAKQLADEAEAASSGQRMSLLSSCTKASAECNVLDKSLGRADERVATTEDSGRLECCLL